MKQTGISGTSLCTRRFTVLYFTSGTSWYPKRFTLPALNLCGSLSLSLSLSPLLLHSPSSMTDGSQQALRRTMEIYSKTTRFALACNTSNKIIGSKFLLYYCEPCNTSSFPSPHQHSTLFSFVFCPLLFEGRFIPPPLPQRGKTPLFKAALSSSPPPLFLLSSSSSSSSSRADTVSMCGSEVFETERCSNPQQTHGGL